MRLIVLLLGCAAAASAWGPIGHQTVGEIAERHLPTRVRLAVAELLDGETLSEAALWADDVRSDPAWKKADPWHYVSIEDDETYETSTKNPAGDVIEAIGRYEAALADPNASREERQTALRFLVHFIGDVHQPLHVGRRADQGGNGVGVQWFGRGANLHTVWDSGILETREAGFGDLARQLDRPELGYERVRDWQQAGVMTWVEESFDLRPRVYDIGDGRLSYAYVFQTWPIVRERLLQAGVRLAGRLEKLF